MRVGISIPVEEGLPIGELVELARVGGALRLRHGRRGRGRRPDVFALLDGDRRRHRARHPSAPASSRCRPGRSALLAMGFQTLASLAPGRVIAGVGVSSPTVVERWHGRTFAPPLAYVRESLPALRAALDGEKLAARRRARSLAGLPDDAAARPARSRSCVAAMRPRMIRLAGELADGAFLTWCPPEEAAERVELAPRGRRAARAAIPTSCS